MHRPTRQHKHLTEKVTSKKSLSHKQKPGRKTKRWNKWLATYAPLASGGEAPAQS